MNKRELGSSYEEQAATFLRTRGMKILHRNFRCYLGEIDLVAQDEDTLVFVEVKYRFSDRYGWGEAHVNKKKQQTIYRVAEVYLNSYSRDRIPPCRFDVVAFDGDRVRYFPNAFERSF